MRIKHIEVFNAIMLTGTISGAARLLHVSQPAVTQTLQHTQLQLGYPLFTRLSNRLVPTQEALTLYSEIQILISQLESIRRIASALKHQDSGHIRILAVPSLSNCILPKALLIFKKKYPNFSITIRTIHSHEIARAIALQEGDVGVVYGSHPHPAVYEEVIATGRLMCVSKSNNHSKRKKIALQELVHEPFIRIDEQDALGAMVADQWSRMGLIPEKGITVYTYHLALILAEEGFGPAIVDSFTANSIQSETLHKSILMPEIPVDIRVLTPIGVHESKSVADFVKIMREMLTYV